MTDVPPSDSPPLPGTSSAMTPSALKLPGGPALDSAAAEPGRPGPGDPRASARGARTATATGTGSTMRAPSRGGRARRPRIRWRAAFFALAGLAIVAGVTWALLGNRVFVVRSVTVTGTHLLAPVQVIAAAGVPLGTPLTRVDPGAVTRRVEAQLSLVASVKVTEDWPDHLVIAVTERVPVLAVRLAAGGYDQVDSDGVIVRWTKDRPAALPVLATSLSGRALRGAPAVAAAAQVLAELAPALAKQVTQVTVTSVTVGGQQVTLGLRDGQTANWGAVGDAAQKNRELAILLPRGARDIDVSDQGTVVTR